MVLGRSEKRIGFVCLVVCGLSLGGCADDPRGARPPRPEEIPGLVLIAEARVTLGTELSVAREERSLGAFRITRHPITARRYRECVSAGACRPPAFSSRECRASRENTKSALPLAGPTFDREDGDDLPATCVKPEQAASYCRWIGGKLPDAQQWLSAARGPTVRRFPWGNRQTACDQLPDGVVHGRRCDEQGPDRFHVGRHPLGASPGGVEDVLLTPTELVGTSADAFVSICRGSGGVCLVTGLTPGAVDNFGPLFEPTDVLRAS